MKYTICNFHWWDLPSLRSFDWDKLEFLSFLGILFVISRETFHPFFWPISRSGHERNIIFWTNKIFPLSFSVINFHIFFVFFNFWLTMIGCGRDVGRRQLHIPIEYIFFNRNWIYICDYVRNRRSYYPDYRTITAQFGV